MEKKLPIKIISYLLDLLQTAEAGPGIQVKGGTTYFSPEFQQGPGRAAGKRPKAAIPIVSPQVDRIYCFNESRACGIL